MSDRLRLTILGGFLGSGKTTWLRHQLYEGHYPAAHLIVNEAADAAVDDALLAGTAGMTVLAGGCACCDALGRLADALRGLCDDRSAGRGVVEVVLETSGLADPARIVAMIRTDPVLARHLTLAEVIVLVDAVEGPARIAAEPLARRQIAAADRLILTKTDRAASQRLRASLAMLAPGAVVTAAVQGVAVPLPVPDPLALPIEIGQDVGDPIQAHVLDLSKTDWPALSVWLSALIHARGDDIMRIKGAVQSPSGPLLLQSVGRVMQRPEPVTRAIGQLVLIGRGTTGPDLSRSLARWTCDTPR
jgi:G3E family GTPase